MNVQIDQLVKSLLQKESLDQCSVQELQQFADRNPYFGAAQLLLTKKLQTENAEQYNEQLQKTFLFFHNPLWVEQLLNETGNVTITKAQLTTTDEITIPEVTIPEQKGTEPDAGEVEIPTARSEEIATELPVLNITAPISQQDDTTKTELVFEPFYTVDYFASLGIKFREEEKPKDKFSHQLRSFTDWLRTMKRLPVSAITVAIEPNAEQKVEQLAEHSLDDREVVTVAMAEVWEKQGNAARAIEIYSKLSLLDPPKSVYFAAKIEDLKKRM
jgi:hypothetical protein